ncbi:uncharacterized protein LOC121425484 [Lytechinus variegatus]|uniref:uncharacterized protein LOC121425484 n=1 Tax=Lytechinus variegatus TaxID=7654 RepID=UPI001BB25FA9|nr:uncharacterized protein LOC121425484 [Lytechinus variegatus]
MDDTQCMKTCIKSTDIFDIGRKACVPDPRFIEETTKAVLTNTMETLEAQADEEEKSKPMPRQLVDNPGLNGKLEFLSHETYLLIGIGTLVIIVVIVLTISNLIICKTYLYHRTKRDKEQQRILPKTTSTGSMTTTSWTSTASIPIMV